MIRVTWAPARRRVAAVGPAFCMSGVGLQLYEVEPVDLTGGFFPGG